MATILTDVESHIKIDNLDLSRQIPKVPPMVYRIGIVDEKPVLVKDRVKFNVPTKRFGTHDVLKKQISSEHINAEGCTGVLLVGLKGAGKSLLSEDICNDAIKAGFPVLMIDQGFTDKLIKSMIKIIGPCVVYFDEYGKIYKEEERNQMLTLFSDTSLKKILWLITANATYELNDFMINRPGRFLFKIDYNGMAEDAILEVVDGLSLEPLILEYLLEYCKCHTISFDVLRVLVKVATDCTTVKQFEDKIKIHNVPDAIHINYHLQEVTLDNAEFEGDAVVENKNGNITVTLRDKTDAKVVDESIVNWPTVKKVALGEDQFRVFVNERVMIKVRRSVTSWNTGPSVLDASTKARRKREKDMFEMDPDHPDFQPHIDLTAPGHPHRRRRP